MRWVRLIYCDYEVAFASISHNMIQVGQYERVRGVLDVANVRNIRHRSFLDIGRSEQGSVFVVQNVQPPVARLDSVVLPGLRSNQVKSQYSCRNSYNCDNFLRTDGCSNNNSIPCPTFPVVGTVAQHVLPRASCRLILVRRTPSHQRSAQCYPLIRLSRERVAHRSTCSQWSRSDQVTNHPSRLALPAAPR